MALTPSSMLALGTIAPDFNLPDTISGKDIQLKEVQGKIARVVMFICNHCPYVVHVREEIVRIAKDYQGKGVGFVAISSNDAIKYPDDSPDKMRELALQLDFPFPYLYDESQDIARSYKAECTPDLYVFDSQLKLVYRGQLDDARPGNTNPVTGKDLRQALDDVIAQRTVNPDQKPATGCNIKWKSH